MTGPRVIRPGDNVLLTGNLAFLDALIAVLGPQQAAGRVVDDLAQRVETYIYTEAPEDGGRLRFHVPRERPEPPALVLYASDAAQLRDRLAGSAHVVLEALSPSVARVVSAGGSAAPNTALHISDGRVRVGRLNS